MTIIAIEVPEMVIHFVDVPLLKKKNLHPKATYDQMKKKSDLEDLGMDP